MLFGFSQGRWLGVHLGMTGSLSVEASDYQISKHDALLLRQNKQTLVFRDPRQFGRLAPGSHQTGARLVEESASFHDGRPLRPELFSSYSSKSMPSVLKSLALGPKVFSGYGQLDGG